MPFSQHLSPKTRDQLSHKILVPLVGPSAVGKTTIMRAVVEADPDFHRSVGFTTRPIRESEEPDSYRFLENSNKQRTQILQQFEHSELIQFVIHPTTGFFYGTNLDDYKGKYNLVDILSSEVINFQALGFASCQTIMIVASPEDWPARFESRGFSNDEATKRISEGITSLKWGFAQENGVRWVENKESGLAETVEHIIAIAKNQIHENDNRARQVGIELFKYLAKLS